MADDELHKSELQKQVETEAFFIVSHFSSSMWVGAQSLFDNNNIRASAKIYSEESIKIQFKHI